jgi:RimJ/RimL family protein N-acetyltransferase
VVLIIRKPWFLFIRSGPSVKPEIGETNFRRIIVSQKTMSRFESITIREVESSDLETFYEHQLDPEAIRMAAFVGKDPKDKVAFNAHWDKILNSSQNTTRTIVAEGQVAGHISC